MAVLNCKMRSRFSVTTIQIEGFAKMPQAHGGLGGSPDIPQVFKRRDESLLCTIEWPPRANRSGRWVPQPANCGGRQPVVEILYRTFRPG